MAKVSRLITLEYELNERLKLEDNASGLIEELLQRHYDLSVLNNHKQPTLDELDAKTKELGLQLDQIDKDKKVIVFDEALKAKLKQIGIDNPFLINRLKAMKKEPSVAIALELKDQYQLKLIEVVWKAWRILHPEQ